MIDTYSIQDETLTAIGDAIRKKGNTTELLSPLEMPQAIDALPDPIEIEPVVLTGSCTRQCSGPIASSYIKNFGNTISTEKITSAEGLFSGSTLTKIPFDINLADSTGGSAPNVQDMFSRCENLEELPNITGSIRYPYYMCANCHRIREIPESWATSIDWSTVNTYTSSSAGRFASMFVYCYSLRRIPEAVLKNIYNKSTTGGWYSSMFETCHSLDELVGFRGSMATMTSNFINLFSYKSRLKRLVFDMDNGSPRIQNWKSQTIDLSGTGYVNSSSNLTYILDYNSGITADKEVKDDATYQTLKNDPDWYTCDINYSRYNHESAVETINSLPDTSAYLATAGGTNTIKFQGAAGAKTFGGAINTLTAEEIAVATAKGWTVSIV